jgi:hypothetical protein
LKVHASWVTYYYTRQNLCMRRITIIIEIHDTFLFS